jgi:hypothetical protein
MIQLLFEDNQSAHADLVLQTPTDECRCDSYYFLIDSNFERDNESPEKVVRGLAALLGKWQSAVVNAADDGTVFLPFDFSDEYTGWLKCEFNGAVANVTRGWSEMGAVFPSDSEKWMTSLSDFQVADDSASFSIERLELLSAIAANLKEFEGDWA